MAAYKAVTCSGVVVIPWPYETVSNLHLSHLIWWGSPTSSISIFGFFVSFVFLINSWKFSLPTFFAKMTEPTLEDLIKISSTDKFFGCSLISVISWIEHLIFLGIFFIIVFVSTKLCSRANATVKVLKIEPNSYTPFVILLINFLSLIVVLLLMLKLGNDTKDIMSPLFTSINTAPPPVASKVLIAWLSSLLIMCWILLSKVNFKGSFRNFLLFNFLSKYFSIPDIP